MYRKLFQTLAGCLMLACACSNKEAEMNVNMVHIPVSADGMENMDKMPQIRFDSQTHNFGKLIQGEKVSFAYKFKNTGKAALVIASVVPSCGCTVADFTKTPLMPDEEGYVSINFNSETKKGFVSSGVIVQANTYPSETRLTFEATVVQP
jgi:hypothetical protein